MTLAISTEDLTRRVIAVVAVEACVSAAEILPTTKLDDLGMDSLDFVALMQSLDLPQETWEGINTVADIVRAMEAQVN